MLLLLALIGCGSGLGGGSGSDADGPGDVPTTPVTTPPQAELVPAAATLHRLTDAEWRNSAEDLLGIRYDGPLPVDYVLHGYVRVGASTLTVGPLDEEQYEAAAWQVAAEAVPSSSDGVALLGCEPLAPGCVRAWAASFARRAWRRPPTATELDALEDLVETLDAEVGDLFAVQALVASVLQSPWFLFRVEVGVPDPRDPTRRVYSDWELAGRLASFLTASVPDDTLLDAAAAGALQDPTTLLAQAERLLATERAGDALASFFSETMELQDLDAVSKDAALYPDFTDTLRQEMAWELELLFRDVALDRDADLAELLTTNDAFVGPELAALYGVAAGAGPTRVTLSGDRGGILGRAAVATLHSHNTLTSPTHRGKFVRARLLCQSIPPPPPGVIADLDAIDGEGTLRDRLEQHASDPACAPCHDAMDPLGYALEHLDPVGRWRDLDNALPIDATGELDGVAFDGARELGAAVAEHPEFAGCVALQLYRHAGGQAERVGELVEVDAITDVFVEEGRRFEPLVLALVASDAFRTATAPLGDVCDAEGTTRACSTACGVGEETCSGGLWRECTAVAPGLESCNGVDDDCDGSADEALEEGCDASGVRGTRTCDAGSWSACEPPGELPPEPSDEVCNGVDDDLDGAVDEDLDVEVATVPLADLAAIQPTCSSADLNSGACRSAAHRLCAARGCGAVAGLPVGFDGADVLVTCFDPSQAAVVATTFTTLGGHHPGCIATTPVSPDCNAAVSRFCGGQGLGTGFGPVEMAGDDATVVCTPSAAVQVASYATELQLYDPVCNGSTQRSGVACSGAIHDYCRDDGFATGHGPLENSGDDAYAACMGVL